MLLDDSDRGLAVRVEVSFRRGTAGDWGTVLTFEDAPKSARTRDRRRKGVPALSPAARALAGLLGAATAEHRRPSTMGACAHRADEQEESVTVAKHHADEERAACLAALVANGGNVAKTVRECGVKRQTLQDWIREQKQAAGQVPEKTGSNPAPKKRAERVAEILPQAVQALDAKLEAIAHQLVDAMPDKIDAATLPQLAVALGVAVDKLLVLRGQLPPDAPEEPVREIVCATREDAKAVRAALAATSSVP
ncbi:MAG: hypothetical protein HYS12_02470 [Planctomycetes bacterium]|nr:hypothetical protein [Planctomycetota bacterium]